jgi:hypothetical protein
MVCPAETFKGFSEVSTNKGLIREPLPEVATPEVIDQPVLVHPVVNKVFGIALYGVNCS